VKSLVAGFITTGALVLSGCGYFIDTRNGAAEGLSAFTVPKYGDVYAAVLAPRCLKCHDQSDDLDVQSIASIRSALPGMIAKVRSGEMPPLRKSPPLTTSQLSLLIRWLEAGAPASDKAPQPEPVPVPLPDPEDSPLLPTYASLRENVLVPKCLKCHSSGGRAEEAPLGTLEELLSLGIVNRENPERSPLVRALRGDGMDLMPPPRGRMEPLTDEEIAVVVEWIRLGTPE
jgi:hypothetical protein